MSLLELLRVSSVKGIPTHGKSTVKWFCLVVVVVVVYGYPNEARAYAFGG